MGQTARELAINLKTAEQHLKRRGHDDGKCAKAQRDLQNPTVCNCGEAAGHSPEVGGRKP
jgi:hypothetical protein